MNFLDAIEQRKSIRSYQVDKPIEQASLIEIMDLIDECNHDFKLNITFLTDGSMAFNSLSKSYGMFKGVRSLIILKGPKNDLNLKEKLGYAGEKIVLKATTLGLGTCFVGGTYDRSNQIFNVANDEELICVITIGYPLGKKTLIEKAFNSTKRSKNISALYQAEGTVPDWFLKGMSAVSKAPSARNSQKVSFQYNHGVVTASVPDNYQFDLVDLGIAKLHFELATGGTFLLGNNATFKNKY